jgi:hypothetical protein
VPGKPENVRLAPGLAVWDQGDAVYVRTWTPAGALAPARPVLTGVQTAWEQDFSGPAWDLTADDAGTVVLAAPGKTAGGILATYRDPGQEFVAPQRVADYAPAPTPAQAPRIALSPVAADGSVTLGWAEPTAYWPGHLIAVRPPRGAFGPPQPGPPDSNAVADPGTATVRLSAQINRLCNTPDGGCTGFKLFRWDDGRELLAFTVDRDGNPWYTATRQADGRFANPVRVYRDSALRPLWTPVPGRLAFAIPGPDEALNVVTQGVEPKLRPRAYVQGAMSYNDSLVLTASCRSSCRLSVRIGNGRTVTRRVDPLQQAYFDAPTPTTKHVRVAAIARDARGRTSRVVRTLTRGRLHEGSIRSWR